MTYQIIITEETAANIVIDNTTTNVNVSTTEYPITIQYNAVIEQAGGNAYGNSNVATFLAAFGANTVSTTGNVSAGYFAGNGSQLTGIVATSSYGNANVAANLAAFGSNPLSTTGNVSAGYVIGNGSTLSAIAGANVTGTVANATYATSAGSATTATTATYATTANAVAGANVTGTVANATYATTAGSATTATSATTAGTVTTAAQANITSVGTLTSVSVTANVQAGNVRTAGLVSATGNVTGNYFIGNGSQLTGITSSYGNANVVANLAALGSNPVSTTGNITAGYVIGNGSLLSNLTGANVTGTVANATYATSAGSATTATSATTAGTVTTAAQPNITSVGILTSVSATGNVTGNYFIGNGSQLTGLAATYGNANVVANLAALGSNPVSTTGNVTAGYFAGNGSLLTSITGANVTGTVANATYATSAGTATSATTAGTVTTAAQGNITSVGILTSLSSTGNITGNYILGNGSQLTGLPVQPGTYGNANVVANVAALGSNPVSTTGNVSAGYFVGNGSLLTGLAATYSNTNATSLLASFGSNTISTTGNVTTGNLNITVDAVVTGNLTVNGTTTTVNSNTVTINDKFINVANNAATAAAANGGGLGVGPVGGEYATLTYNSTNNNWNTNIALSVAGNITGNYILGNGSQLTDLPVQPGTYGNANVVANIAALGTNPVSTTGNITAGYVIGNGSLLSSITGANVTGTVANATFATSAGSATTATSANTAATVTGNAQANITSVGILTSLSSTGNIDGANINGNGSGLSSITGANVTGTVANATFATTAGSANTAITVTGNAQANITSVGVLTSLSVSGNTTSGNVTTTSVQATSSAGLSLKNSGGTTQASMGAGGGDNFAINVSTNLNGNNAQIDISPTGTGHVHIKPTGTGAVEIAPTSTGSINNMVIGNVTPAAVSATTVSATGNITGNYFIGNGSQLTGISAGGTPGGNTTEIQYNNGGAFAGSANLTFNNTTNTLATTTVTATANINGANLSITGNATAANVFSTYTSNGTIITSTQASNVNALVNPYRIVYGNGFRGDYSINADPANFNRGSQLAAIGTQVLANADTTNTSRLMTSSYFMDLAQGANITNTNKRYSAGGFYSQIGNGNITLTAAAGTNMGAVLNGGTQTLLIGNSANANLGAVSVSHAAALNSTFIASTGGTVGNATGALITLQTAAANASFTTSQIGYTAQFLGTTGTPAGNVIGYYMPSNVTTNYGFNSTNLNRAATNYYFLKNDDTVAQTQLGSLRSYNEFRYDTATTGNITLDKNNAQVQYIAPTANVTIDGYANMITSLSDSVNTDQEIDTLTVLVQQGATPYTVTLPTGATYQYAGNISTVPAVANSRSILTVVAANIAGTVNYFTTVQSDQAVTVSAGGSNTQLQFNNAGVLSGNAAMTFDNTTGNVTLANVIIGTTGAGNAILGGNAQRINTSNAFSGTATNASEFAAGQIVIGNGFFGNLNLNNAPISATRAGKVVIWDSANVAEVAGVGFRYNGLTVQPQISIGNVANTGTLVRGGAGSLNIGGGASANTWSATFQGLGAVAGFNQALFIGQPNATVALGNVTLQGGAASLAQAQVYAGSNVGNLVGSGAQIINASNITTALGMAAYFTGTATTTPTNLFGYYMPGTTNSYGPTNSNTNRAATNYYFLRNDDAVAQNQLGSLRAYHTFQAGGNTTGTWNIDKDNGQVQAISLTGNVTIGSYTDFVTTANDGTNNDSQTDTVTLIIEQGATPYTVTMPTGNASIKYANGVSTVTATANTTTMINITAFRTAANATSYLTTISPAFS